MLPNSDSIARPAKGRFFALSIPELLALLHELSFSHSTYRKRIDIAFVNADLEDAYGVPLASFCPREFVALYSFPDTTSLARARLLQTAVVREFALLDKTHPTRGSGRELVSFRAYLAPLNRLTITERRRTATLAKYRGDAKFSNAFKPKAIRQQERPIHELTVA